MAAKYTRYEVTQRLAVKPVVIYGLSDPLTGELRYVGKTVKSLRHRLKSHLVAVRRGESKHHAGNWLRKLIDDGVQPEIFEIELVPVGGDWVEAESHWIALMRALGCRLTNMAAGGQGAVGYKAPPEHREKLRKAHLGQQRTPEIIEKWRAAMQAKREAGWKKPPLSAEAKAKGLATKAENKEAGLHKPRRKATDEERRRASEARKACDTPEMRARISAARRRGIEQRRLAAQAVST